MEKRTKIIIVFILALVCIIILLRKTDGYKMTSVMDGNTIKLENGTTVKLIGVSSTNEGKSFLEQNFLNKPVDLVCDNSAPFDATMISADDLVYAYVMGGENANVHINAQLLREGKASLLEGTFLSDSLTAFRNYASAGGGENLTPTPVPVINYEEDDIILPDPPKDRKKERKHHAWYDDGNMNIEMLDDACDYLCPYTKQFANSLAAKSEGNFNAGQICEIFEYCFTNWKYVNDPTGHEYVASASESIEGNLAGDCDDFAVLMASCILAIGGDACVNTSWGPEGGHAFAEVDIAPIGESAMRDAINQHFSQFSPSGLHTRRDGGHIWLNLDWQASYPGGKYFKYTNRDAYTCIEGEWTWEHLQ